MTLRCAPGWPRFSYGALLVVAACGGGIQATPRDIYGPTAPWPSAAPRRSVSAAPIAEEPPPPPPPPEPVPEQLGTPASSEAKRPVWVPANAGYVPQPVDRRGLFDASSGPLTSQQVGIVCKLVVTTTNHGEADGLADLAVVVSISQNKKEIAALYARGPEDTTEMWFAVPLVSPEKGATIRVRSIDRDILFDDGIETIAGTFEGTYPFEAKGRVSRVECRPVGRSSVEQRLEYPRSRADQRLAAMERVKPDVHERYFGVDMAGDGGAYHVRSALDDMAGLVGWDDPRVVRRVERLAVQQERIQTELGAAVEAKRATLPAPANDFHAMADGGVAVRVTSYACGPDQAKKYQKWVGFRTKDDFKARPCVLAFDIENRTGVPFEVDEFRGKIGPLENLEMVSPQGARFKVALFGAVRGGKIERVDFEHRPIVPNGTTLSLLAHPVGHADLSAFAPPLLLRALHSKRRTGTPREWTSFLGGIVEMRATELVCKDKRCVLRAELRRTGSAKVSIDAFFRRLEPSLGIRLLDPAAFTTPKPKRKGSLSYIDDGIEGPVFQPYATIEQGALRSFDKDFDLVPGQTVTIQFGMSDDRLLPNMDLDKVVLDSWFDAVPSFVRVE